MFSKQIVLLTAPASFITDKAGVYPYYSTSSVLLGTFKCKGHLLVKPKVYKAKAGAQKEGQYIKATYMKKVKTNNDTQAVIDSVAGYITSRNYYRLPEMVALVEDATEQMGFAEAAKKKAEAFAAKGDYQNATFWAGQHSHYQVKTADPGLRVKTFLEQHGVKKVKKKFNNKASLFS